ncbi:MAG: Lrp/AsnC family leucine-responsive transcriptional regulator [Patescibacteria group bacterium]|jgi:Lrp/AsnC family leucine-responsive transcriptional regulator
MVNQKEFKNSFDVKDKNILSILGADARTTFHDIAKEVGLSRDAVTARVKKYEEGGLINGYRMLVDISRFGYMNYHFFLVLNNPDVLLEKRIVDKLEGIAEVRALIKYGGAYDYEVALIARDTAELARLVGLIEDACEGTLREYNIMVMSDTYFGSTFPKSFYDYSSDSVKVEPVDLQLDSVDYKILTILSSNSRSSLVFIAGEVGLSADAVSYRVRKMLRAGYILGFVPVIDYEKMGYTFNAIMLSISGMNLDKERAIRGYLSHNEHVIWCGRGIGQFTLILYVLTTKISELRDTLSGIRGLFPGEVNNCVNLVMFERCKYTYFPSELF